MARTVVGALLLLLTAALVPTPAGAVIGGEPSSDAGPTVAIVTATAPDSGGGADTDGASQGSSAAVQICGGTLIAPDLVLTAAHCFHAESGVVSRGPADVEIVAGVVDLTDPGAQRAVGAELYIHPAYQGRRSRFDAAIVKLSEGLDAPLQVLAEADAAPTPPGTLVRVLGWGATVDGEPRPTLRHEARLQVSSTGRCHAAYDSRLDRDVHMCAGGDGEPDAPAADACNGDSGGPLLLDEGAGEGVQVGIVAFGAEPCGVGEPGVYTRVSAVRPFIDDVVRGDAEPTVLRSPGEDVPAAAVLRVSAGPELGTSAPAQARASSRAVFGKGAAAYALLARGDIFADALAGSSLGFGLGPILFVESSGDMSAETEAELQRVVSPGGRVYLLGGPAALPERLDDHLLSLGYVPARLAGAGREETAVAVADAVIRNHGRGELSPPYFTVVVATRDAWPDAVLAGQLGAWWGFPILLTGANSLHPATAAALQRYDLDRVLVVGGTSAIDGRTLADIRTAAGSAVQVTRLGGATRIETGTAVARWHLSELAAAGLPPADAAVAVNLRRDDAFAHALSATPILAATAGVFAPVEGADGSVLPEDTVDLVCGLGLQPIVVGGWDLVSLDAASALRDALAGDC